MTGAPRIGLSACGAGITQTRNSSFATNSCTSAPG